MWLFYLYSSRFPTDDPLYDPWYLIVLRFFGAIHLLLALWMVIEYFLTNWPHFKVHYLFYRAMWIIAILDNSIHNKLIAMLFLMQGLCIQTDAKFGSILSQNGFFWWNHFSKESREDYNSKTLSPWCQSALLECHLGAGILGLFCSVTVLVWVLVLYLCPPHCGQ